MILPLVVARRLDQVLLPTKAAVLERATELEAQGVQNVEPALIRTAGHWFFNRSSLDVRGINELFIQKFLDDEDLRERVSEGVLRAVYERLRIRYGLWHAVESMISPVKQLE